ncbi:MAG TPA: hypothetical protein VK988_05310 [Acidimicrobiales bacterium]|nr:hypothetical protein [Acidimicrobiales bacterium]
MSDPMPPVGSTGQVAGGRRLERQGEASGAIPPRGSVDVGSVSWRRQPGAGDAAGDRSDAARPGLAAGRPGQEVTLHYWWQERRPSDKTSRHRGKTWPDTGLPPAAIRADGCRSGGRRRPVKGSHDRATGANGGPATQDWAAFGTTWLPIQPTWAKANHPAPVVRLFDRTDLLHEGTPEPQSPREPLRRSMVRKPTRTEARLRE